MVVAASWYLRAFDRASNVTVTFSPYDIAPLGTGGGADSVAGTYGLPDERGSKVFFELSSGATAAQMITPVPTDWWTSGVWDSNLLREATTPLTLNPDAYAVDRQDNTVDLTMLTWDGSPEPVWSSESSLSLTALDALNHAAGQGGVNFVVSGTKIGAAPFTGPFPQLQGVLTDVIRQLTTALGATIYYTPSVAGQLGIITVQPPVIRLVNGHASKRTFIQPSYVPNVKVQSYNTKAVTSKVIYSSPDVIQVTSGEDQEIRVPLDGTPLFRTLVQPNPVTGIPVIPYPGPASIYCVYDSDGYEASGPWKAYGGKITVAAGALPDELLIKIKAPSDPGNAAAVYSIGEDGNPAFYITAGTATVYNKKELTFGTGAVVPSSTYRPTADVPEMDNPAVINLDLAYARGAAMIGAVSEASITIEDVTFDNAVITSTTPGGETAAGPAAIAAGKFRAHDAMWRFATLTYSPEAGYSGTAVQATTVGDFDASFAGMTLLDFQNYLAAQYPDGVVPSIGTGSGQFPTGTNLGGVNLTKPSPTIDQFDYEPLRAAQ